LDPNTGVIFLGLNNAGNLGAAGDILASDMALLTGVDSI